MPTPNRQKPSVKKVLIMTVGMIIVLILLGVISDYLPFLDI